MPEYEDKIKRPNLSGFKSKKRPRIKRYSNEPTKSDGDEIPRITSIEQIPPAFRMRFKTHNPGEYDTELEPPSEPFDILDAPAYQIRLKRNDGGIDKRFVPASEPRDILDDPAYRIPLKTNDPENPETTVYDAFIKHKNTQDQKVGEQNSNKSKQIASLDPGWGAGFDPDWVENQQAIIQGIQEIFPEFANIALDFVPIVGDVKGIAEAIAGKDITGAELANWERALGAVPFFGGILKKVEVGKKVKGFIKLPGVWVVVDTAGKKFDELIDYLASKLPSWKQRTRLAIAGEGGFEAPSEVASSMMNAMTGANAGVTFLNKYRDSFNLKLWGKAEGTIINFLKRSGLTDELKEEVVQTLLKIQDGIISEKLDIKDSGLAASFQDVVGRLSASEINTVEENLAELQRAVQVIESGDLDGVVAIGVRKGYKPKNLPEIDVNKVEADTYYRTSDGAIHLNEVKNTPNAFVSKLKEGAKKKDGGQFQRYADWMAEGVRKDQVRQAIVYIRNSEPKFHEIIDNEVLEILSDNIAKDNTTETILQIKNVQFSFDELQLLYKDADKKLRQLVKQEEKLQPDLEIRDLIGIVLDRNFDSMEQTFKTLGKTYGH